MMKSRQHKNFWETTMKTRLIIITLTSQSYGKQLNKNVDLYALLSIYSKIQASLFLANDLFIANISGDKRRQRNDKDTAEKSTPKSKTLN